MSPAGRKGGAPWPGAVELLCAVGGQRASDLVQATTLLSNPATDVPCHEIKSLTTAWRRTAPPAGGGGRRQWPCCSWGFPRRLRTPQLISYWHNEARVPAPQHTALHLGCCGGRPRPPPSLTSSLCFPQPHFVVTPHRPRRSPPHQLIGGQHEAPGEADACALMCTSFAQTRR